MNFIESNCTISHDGREFTSGGAWRTENRALVYVVETETGISVTDWHGNKLGTASILSSWTVYTSTLGSCCWRSYRVHLSDGTFWHGRHNSDCGNALRIKLSR